VIDVARCPVCPQFGDCVVDKNGQRFEVTYDGAKHVIRRNLLPVSCAHEEPRGRTFGVAPQLKSYYPGRNNLAIIHVWNIIVH